jgi:DNA modification methylase
MTNAINDLWDDLHLKYNSTPEPIQFNFRENAIKFLNEKRNNTTAHGIYPYPGRLYPYIPLVLLSLDILCPPKGKILDPFCGSGTVLLESLINPIHKRSAIGIEINPIGRLISKVKTTPLNLDIINEKKEIILNDFKNTKMHSITVPNTSQFHFWYSKKALQELTKLKNSINNLENDDYKDFFWLNFSFLTRKISHADPFIPPAVLLKPYKYENSTKKKKTIEDAIKNAENPNLSNLFTDLVSNNSKRIASLNNIIEIQMREKTAEIIWDDARIMKYGSYQYAGKISKTKTKKIPKNSIDFIITSPPYLTAQKYIRTSLLELMWFEDIIEEKRLEIQNNSIGKEDVHLTKTDFHDLGIPNIDNLVKKTLPISKSRAAEVFQYFYDMKIVFEEMHRVLKNGANAVLIIGNNRVVGETIETHKFLGEIGKDCGFEIMLELKDPIRTRGMITKRHGNGGLIKEEYALIFKKET